MNPAETRQAPKAPAGERPRPARLGPAVFVATLAAVLVFFWWFLIAPHGVPGPT